jgi:hypothetical protein
MSRPPLLTQLNDGASTAGYDCSVITILNGMRDCSDGKAGPQKQIQVDDYVRETRQVARNLHMGFLMEGDALQVDNSAWFRHEFQKHGLTPPRVEYRHNIGWGTLLRRLHSGQFVHLAVDYGVLNDGDAPTGSLDFRGDHSVAIVDDYNGPHGHRYAHIGDPLFDGRTRWVARSGGRWWTYPKGWQGARLLEYRNAAGRWGSHPPGPGRCTAIFLTPR